MKIDDFAFIYQGKITKSLSEQDASYLLSVDSHLTKRQDKALLLLHGFASSPAVYRAILPHLTGYDRIVCPALPGHSDSIAAFAKATSKNWLDIATQHCANLVNTYQQVSVVGMSMGGILALELSQHFSLHHLYLLAPALKLHYSATMALWGIYALKALGIKSMNNAGGDFYHSHYQELSYRRLPLHAIMEILSLIKTQKPLYPTCPTDVCLGRYDKVVDSHYIEQHFTHQPNTTIHWLDHSAHLLPLDGDIEQLIQLIRG